MYFQRKFITNRHGLNDSVDLNSGCGHRRCFKNKLRKVISQLNNNINIPELRDILDINNDKNIENINNDEKNEIINEDKINFSNFMKYKFDKLLLIPDRNYNEVFIHLDIGETSLLNKNFIPTLDQIKTNTETETQTSIESLIFEIDNTHNCGICNKPDDGSKMVCCDGPRPIMDPNIQNNHLLCNQWYHVKCLNNNIKNDINNINKLEPFFGTKCKHNIWFDSLNNNCKNIVKEKINLLRNNINIDEYKKEKNKMKCFKSKIIDTTIKNNETKLRINRIKKGIKNKNTNINNIKKYKYKLKR